LAPEGIEKLHQQFLKSRKGIRALCESWCDSWYRATGRSLNFCPNLSKTIWRRTNAHETLELPVAITLISQWILVYQCFCCAMILAIIIYY